MRILSGEGEENMRIAVLIIGLMLTVGLFIQAMVISGLSNMADDKNTGAAAGIGVVMALMWLVASGLVIPVPRVSMVLFALAGGLGFLGVSDYPDLAFWAVVSLVLALFSYFGYRSKRTSDQTQADQTALIREARAIIGDRNPAPIPQPEPLATQTVHCPQCGTDVPATVKFCPNCGLTRTVAPSTA